MSRHPPDSLDERWEVRSPSLLKFQMAVGPGGVLPAGVAGLAPLAQRLLDPCHCCFLLQSSAAHGVGGARTDEGLEALARFGFRGQVARFGDCLGPVVRCEQAL